MPIVLLIDPRRGEIWQVSLDPTLGAELQKTRPVVVLNHPDIGRKTLRIVAPVLGWQAHHMKAIWFVTLLPSKTNGLTKASSIDMSQLRSVDLARFRDKLGTVTPEQLNTLIDALKLCIE